MKLLLVEDDLSLVQQLVKNLSNLGHRVDHCADGLEGYYRIQEFAYDLAIIDIGLPKLSGIDLIQKARDQEIAVPILILTARSRWQDKVEGLNAGADDYLVKPFQFEELEARINAMTRRVGGFSANELSYGPYRLDLDSQELFVEEQPIKLTSFEYNLIDYFLRYPKRVHSKNAIADYLYAEDADPDSNVIEVVVGRLRKKLDPKNQYNPIETLRNRGYRFAPKEPSANALIESSAET